MVWRPYAIVVSVAHRVVSIYNERYDRIRGECALIAHIASSLSSFPRAVVQSGNSVPTFRDTGVIHPGTLPRRIP